MTQFISFGSGSSGNCYVVYTESAAIMIDTGIGVRVLKKRMYDYNVSLSKVKYILITHDHADHIKSVGSISAPLSLPVYATEPVHHGIDKNYSVGRKIPIALRHYISKGQTLSLEPFRVTPFAVPHDSSDNVGYFIETPESNICIMTDAGTVTEEMKSYIARAHNLVIEANHDLEMLDNGPYPVQLKERIKKDTGHLSNHACAEAIANNMTQQLKHVWLCHLSNDNNHPELARKTVEMVLRSYGIIAGKDLALDVLKRTETTGPWEL